MSPWHTHLHGDPRFTEADMPAPCHIERLRAITCKLMHPETDGEVEPTHESIAAVSRSKPWALT